MNSQPSAASAPRPSLAQWYEGARPHTWANALAPVIMGTAAAAAANGAHLGKAALALIVSWALIVGVNYANDYSDGIRGTDEQRTGPLRLVGSGLARPSHVKYAAFAFFGLAGIAGMTLAILSSWWLVAVGVVCILAAWFYTGGTNPYGYRGLGEVAVFIFFGLVAVLGTQFSQLGSLTWIGFGGACAIGAMSAGVNLVNNLRDIPTDKEAGKITLAVRLGDRATRILYYILVSIPLIASLSFAVHSPFAASGLIVAPLIVKAAKPIRAQEKGKALIPVLGTTGKAMLAWSILTCVGLVLSLKF
ncbi:1,4-dihydroxy-2-naphthoate polyprenyltransferase [Corynebacterium felinum]|uniref:1,4-dihydroxy-2-naphthoate octaprenyltransferase n=1 Tax=Corynebacterium felinum TaxID=131318 RepID=A0ABU2B7I9_9CORY|nr:1,4-dihydroxy-2-naphthoate polyprenyltransferase [Corynebacterium felinum]MDF5819948.1 1,4-dihydroxy-2-naphthoate polyprenyltransferase [Corynebacterium felinum]MDR7354565.1 1,4-dihydroxy-2-naphthoate octaprenyltransferase [Corynebacterium felinum]WJY93932.1 1,4-dihydroxy-2-naphthoate octaprenyltransferase [Corynebacterium felinum]